MKRSKVRRKKARMSLQDKAMAALREAVKEVVECHKKTGCPLPVWKDGRVVYLSAKEL